MRWVDNYVGNLLGIFLLMHHFSLSKVSLHCKLVYTVSNYDYHFSLSKVSLYCK